MALIKDGRIVDDPWVAVADDAALPADGPVVVSLERWRDARDDLARSNRAVGVRLRSDQAPGLIGDGLHRLSLVALAFPKFTDGRAYSSARLLRERLGFKGEVRAVGNVLRDQLAFMQRCGFDAFEVEGADAEAWAAAVSEVSVVYQPAADARRPASALRRRRQAAE